MLIGLIVAIGFAAIFGAAWVFVLVKNAAAKGQIAALSQREKENVAAAETARKNAQALAADLAAAQTRETALTEKLAAQTQEIARVRAELQKDFQLLAERVFQETQKGLSQTNREQIDLTLKPLREKLGDFAQSVREAQTRDTAARAQFAEQIRQLSALNQQMNAEAAALTRALKGDNKTVGNWGEMVLEKLLELCGLREGETYLRQAVAHDEAGKRQIPDVVVLLPENKFLIIDSKTSLKNYADYAAAPAPEAAAPYLKAFVASVKTHIDELSKKDYASLEAFKHSPEFVMLFIPVESAFYALIKEEPDIYEYALRKKIALVSASNLLATLKTVESVWRLEKQNANAMKIAELGGRVHREIENFLAAFQGVGDAIEKARRAYAGAEDKLYAADRNTLKKAAQSLEELGAKVQKRLTGGRAKNADAALPETAEALPADDENAADTPR